MPIQSFLRFFSVWVHRRYDVAVYRRCATSKKSVSRNMSVLYFFSWQFTWCTLDVLSSRRLPHCSAIPLQWFHSSASCKRPDEMFKVSHSTSHWRIQGRGPGTLGNPLFLPPLPPISGSPLPPISVSGSGTASFWLSTWLNFTIACFFQCFTIW